MAYQAFRTNGAPTYYDANPTAWQADILEAGLIFAFCIVAVSFYIILPGIRGKEKLFTFIRVTVSLYIGAVIVLTNWSYTWETGAMHTKTKYKAGTGKEITADIGVNIGLRGVNITLKGDPEHQLNETINYNEHFGWEWEQGRLGFGPFAGPFNQEYRAAQFRGLPLPILWIAEYFTFDGEGIRWGRHYRQAGWFAHISLWFCFPMWLLTNVLFFVLIKYGAISLAFTGLCMVVANILWSSWRNVNDLRIPWEAGVMEFKYGGSYYICLITGVVCMIAGLFIYIVDLCRPDWATTFFGVDVLQDDEDNLVSEEEEPRANGNNDAIEMRAIDGGGSSGSGPMRPPIAKPMPAQALMEEAAEEEDDEELYAPPEPVQPPRYEKQKSRGLTIKKFQRSRRHRAPPPIPGEEDEQEMYVNERYNVGAGDVRINVP
ncbi:dual oxidase maturation factor 1-like isoform X2 [Mya arenaria]|uniref:dual oxidase maturation factor 1-like isoform X2 n=1 Tax=Mya arenaria TaxID=6604 RepID=UPI0022E5A49E|nr:dual oxidase maturation factor 1-like isoform X2 [Mya arenaria]